MSSSNSLKVITDRICTPSCKNRCSVCSPPLSRRVQKAVERIRAEYVKSTDDWFLGFSGGKDSTAVLQLTMSALRGVRKRTRRIVVAYCDTGVEIPVIASMVRSTLRRLSHEARESGLPISTRLLQPHIEDRYFVKVIGRRYPTPTNKFRWCTDRLRINPVKRLLATASGDQPFVLLGTREGESNQRDRTLAAHATSRRYIYEQGGNTRVRIFAPIIDFRIADVWATNFGIQGTEAVDTDVLARMYRDADAECPMIKDPNGTPCGAGRFGCWTCTVVRKDRAVSSMISEGHRNLQPLFDYRNWIAELRDDPSMRCRYRRNGAKGPGPFTLDARKLLLRRLRKVQERVPWTLIRKSEVREIHRLWRLDQSSSTYRE